MEINGVTDHLMICPGLQPPTMKNWMCACLFLPPSCNTTKIWCAVGMSLQQGAHCLSRERMGDESTVRRMGIDTRKIRTAQNKRCNVNPELKIHKTTNSRCLSQVGSVMTRKKQKIWRYFWLGKRLHYTVNALKTDNNIGPTLRTTIQTTNVNYPTTSHVLHIEPTTDFKAPRLQIALHQDNRYQQVVDVSRKG
jgi:hypothetical protein